MHEDMMQMRLKDNPELQEALADCEPGSTVVMSKVKVFVTDKDEEAVTFSVEEVSGVEVEKEPPNTPVVRVGKGEEGDEPWGADDEG